MKVSFPVSLIVSNPPTASTLSTRESRAVCIALSALCALILFTNLGGPALFEPDEGRNAEKSREVLILGDWITPHENFLPVLDKPIAFYWATALSYVLFGVSEASARLPSTLAALGCILLVYHFARRDGLWVARWSVLILLTSVEFVLLSRIVISDMLLTFFITAALLSFYSAANAASDRTRLLSSLSMYGALGLATLVKGLAGLVLPGIVAAFYLVVSGKWRNVRRLHLAKGVGIYALVAAPWYTLAELRNPGYLRYFFWEEHFGRFWTDEFNRSQEWYYFVGVLAVGFLPWTVLLPVTVKRLWRSMSDREVFLAAWVVLPFILFSCASSKLPHYLLPVFPPLAVLTAQSTAALFAPGAPGRRGLFSVWGICAAALAYLTLGAIAPAFAARRIRDALEQNGLALAIATAIVLIACVSFGRLARADNGGNQARAFVCSGLILSVFLLGLFQLHQSFSFTRSAKALAETIAPLVQDVTLVSYNTYPTGLVFYLRRRTPLLIISPRRSGSPVMDNPYLHAVETWPVSRFGKVLLTTEEFSALAAESGRPVRVLVKDKDVARFLRETRTTVKPLTRSGERLLLAAR